MLLTLRGLPPDIEIPKIRSYIQERCAVGRFLLDELAADTGGTQCVTVATMSDVDGTNLVLALSGEQLGAYTLRMEPHHSLDANGMDSSTDVSEPNRYKTKIALRDYSPCNTSKGSQDQSCCNRRDSSDHGGQGGRVTGGSFRHGKNIDSNFNRLGLQGSHDEDRGGLSGFGGDIGRNYGSGQSGQFHGRKCDELGKRNRVDKNVDGRSSKRCRDSSDGVIDSDVIFGRSRHLNVSVRYPDSSHGGELVGYSKVHRSRNGCALGGHNEPNSFNEDCGLEELNVAREQRPHRYTNDNARKKGTRWDFVESPIEEDRQSVEMEDCWLAAESETEEYTEVHDYSWEREHPLHTGRMQPQHAKFGTPKTAAAIQTHTSTATEECFQSAKTVQLYKLIQPAGGKRSNQARPDGVNMKLTSALCIKTNEPTMKRPKLEIGCAEDAMATGDTQREQHKTPSAEGNRKPSPIEGCGPSGPKGKRARRKAAKKVCVDNTPPQKGDSKRVKTYVPRVGSVSYEDMSKSKLLVAVAAKPSVALTVHQGEQLKKYLEKSILNAVLSSDDSATTFAPAFRGRPFLHDGVLKMWCEDEQSLEWLKRAVEDMPPLIKGLNLTVFPQSEIGKMAKQVKAALLLPTEHRDTEKIHRVLCAQNPWYDINSWTLLNASVQEGKGFFLTLNIPEVEVEKLTKRSRRVAFSTGSVYVRYFTRRGLSDTPPETATTKKVAVETDTTSTERNGASAVADVITSSGVRTEDKDVILKCPTH